MVKNIKVIKILDNEIEMCPYIKEKSLLYNPKNNKLILTTRNTIENIKNLKDSQAPDKVKKFIFSKYKRGKLYNFHFIRLKLKRQVLEPLLLLLYVFSTPLAGILTLIANFVILATPGIISKDYISEFSNHVNQEISSNIIFLFIGTLIILILHELSHFAVYSHYLKPIYFSCGLSIRYFSLLLFFTDVPFLRTLNSREKRQVTLAGIETQLFISLLLFSISYIFKSTIFFILYLQNIGLIVTNLMPFFKLDGYWLINSLMGTEDYMKDFSKMLTNKKIKEWKVMLMGTINSFLILINLLLLVYAIYNLLA